MVLPDQESFNSLSLRSITTMSTTTTTTTTALNTTLIGVPTDITSSEKYCASCGHEGVLSQGEMAAEEAQRRIKELEAQVQFLKLQNTGSGETKPLFVPSTIIFIPVGQSKNSPSTTKRSVVYAPKPAPTHREHRAPLDHPTIWINRYHQPNSQRPMAPYNHNRSNRNNNNNNNKAALPH